MMVWALVVLAGFLAVVPVAVATGTLLVKQVQLADAMDNAATAADAMHITSPWTYRAMTRQDLGSSACHLDTFRVTNGRIAATMTVQISLLMWGRTVVMPVSARVN